MLLCGEVESHSAGNIGYEPKIHITNYRTLLIQDVPELLKEYGVGWNDPYDVIFEFEKRLAEYTGAPM